MALSGSERTSPSNSSAVDTDSARRAGDLLRHFGVLTATERETLQSIAGVPEKARSGALDALRSQYSALEAAVRDLKSDPTKAGAVQPVEAILGPTNQMLAQNGEPDEIDANLARARDMIELIKAGQR